ncbi:DUF3892 domain-containing protein [Fructilactobacillus florum]|uniref:DUF3892 domain-containing protein n=1 Tax=Fructilactobacillus florum TaxID=640331 RepID=UPI0006D16EFF|nr:DUF3892 domain-containing protein [Fructilactobacillus florum]
MSYEIKEVHLDSDSNYESDITKVKLSDGKVEQVSSVVINIDDHMKYYFTSSSNTKTLVDSVHPLHRDPYIRTVPNQTTSDNLLSLTRF